MSSLADRLAQLSPEQRALLERRLRSQRPADGPSSTRGAAGPLSAAQRLLWAADLLAPGSVHYAVPSATRLRGPLDAGALAEALSDVVARHDALRAVFESTPEGPVQRTSPPAPVPLPLLDVSDRPDPQQAARDAVDGLAERPFDLETGPLFRAALVRIGPDDHVLLVNIHHIVYDGWSEGVFSRDLADAYAERLAGRAPRRARPAQYAEFVAWQTARLEGGELADSLAYWERSLEGVPPLDLPTPRPRPRVRTHEGAAVPLTVPGDAVAAVAAFAREEKATPFMVYLAAYQALLGRTAGQDDFAVLTPVAGRSETAFEDAVGYFVNTVAIRASLDDAPSFRALVRQARGRALDALAHQEVPFERVAQTVRAERPPNRTPIAQAVFSYQSAPSVPYALSGLEATPFGVSRQTSKFELALSITPGPQSIAGHLTYAADLFDAETARRLAQQYVTLLAGLLADPDAPVESVSLLTEEERDRQRAWNETDQAVPADALGELFRRQAARTPDAVALDGSGRCWSYGALDAWSDRLAARLADAGVVAGARVGITAERSAAFVAGVLAVVKAGAAYVPLDPDYPAERLAWMAEDAGLAAVLGPASPLGDVPIVALDDRPGAPAAPVPVDPEAPAYVMYTSGSTGVPKGVVVTHRSVAHLVLDTDYVDVRPGDTVAHLASTSFDAATFEIWGALLNGARLAVLDRDTIFDPRGLADAFRVRAVDVAFLTTSLFNLVAREVPGAFAPLRTVLFGGERADPHAVRAALADPPRRLLNAYGPTETTTFASWHEVSGLAADATSVPIGRPIAGATLWVLDAARQPVPVGVPGELYVGGLGVAAGYLDRPDLTAERFVPDPFSDRPGARLYRTGDRARRLDDGAIDYLGRIDRQVKLRGFRIEPGEVEARLQDDPAVADALVTVLDAETNPRLVAFVVAAAGAVTDPAALRSGLQGTLPDHLVPSAIRVVAEIPLTANGKADLRALPEVSPRRAAPERLATEAERHLADVWEEVLGVRPERRDADFFELGGHSLLAVQMLAAVRRAFGHAPPLAILFEASTLQRFAQHVQDETLRAAGSNVFAMDGGGTAGAPVLFAHGAEANCLQYVKLARLLGADRPVYGTQGQGVDGGDITHGSLEEIAGAYADEWRGLAVPGPVTIVGLCYGAVLACEIGRQLRAQGAEVAAVVSINQNDLPRTQRLARRGPLVWAAARGVRRGIGRRVREALWALDRRAGGLGPFADLPYVRGALAFEHDRHHPPSREVYLARSYAAIVEADRAGRHGHPPEDVRDALALHAREHVRSTYMGLFEAYRGRPFDGRFVHCLSDAHADDALGESWAECLSMPERVRVDGPHSPLYEPHVRSLADALGEIADAA